MKRPLLQAITHHQSPVLLIDEIDRADEEFESFLLKNGIKHITSAPYHPATNGLAERAVQTVKKGLKKERGGSMARRLAKDSAKTRMDIGSQRGTVGVKPR